MANDGRRRPDRLRKESERGERQNNPRNNERTRLGQDQVRRRNGVLRATSWREKDEEAKERPQCSEKTGDGVFPLLYSGTVQICILDILSDQIKQKSADVAEKHAISISREIRSSLSNTHLRQRLNLTDLFARSALEVSAFIYFTISEPRKGKSSARRRRESWRCCEETRRNVEISQSGKNIEALSLSRGVTNQLSE